MNIAFDSSLLILGKDLRFIMSKMNLVTVVQLYVVKVLISDLLLMLRKFCNNYSSVNLGPVLAAIKLAALFKEFIALVYEILNSASMYSLNSGMYLSATTQGLSLFLG